MPRLEVEGWDVLALTDGWQAAASDPDEAADPRELDQLPWLAARVPGTAAGALRDAGLWRIGQPADVDGRDWWFRTRFGAPPPRTDEEIVLSLEGIATVAEVFLNGERVLESDSMFVAHAVEVGRLLLGENELAIRCRALAPLLRRRRRPRARWRTRLVSEGNLRFFRTMLIGRAPGCPSGPPVVGPWRPVCLERRRGVVAERLELRPRVEGRAGVLAVTARLRGIGPFGAGERVWVELSGPSGEHRAELAVSAGAHAVEARGELTVPDVELWWPHTHGQPVLHEVTLRVHGASGAELRLHAGRVGFRTLAGVAALEQDGLRLRVNGVDIFARGALWTPLFGAVSVASEAELRRTLEAVVAAGMNMLRVPGVGCYESATFHDLLDELGIMLWQDFMFANFDYPEQDEAFMRSVELEVRQALSALAGRPSLAVLCGGSEVAQQVAMLGLDPALASGPLFGELLPSLVGEAGLDAVYVPSTPWGGDLPFRTNRGVAHYYGVGNWRRGIEDVRRCEVRFAAETLAFSNVPDEAALAPLEAEADDALAVHHPRWKAGVPRDLGVGYDFDDIRDHYLRELFAVDPVQLRSVDQERYFELSRVVTGELMAEVFGEWRREASPCAGGLVLWLSDLAPGAGWGVLDHAGAPKAAYHHLRRALAPVAVWSTDEGLNGVAVHVANDTPAPVLATLRVALYRDFEVVVGQASKQLELAPHGWWSGDVEALLGRFDDVSWAYRFGPPAQDLIVMSLEQAGAGEDQVISQAFRFPAGRPTGREPASRLGLRASAHSLGDDQVRLSLHSQRFAYGVRVHVPGLTLPDDAFSIEPGGERVLTGRRVVAEHSPLGGRLTALNLAGHVSITEAAE